MQDVQKKDSGVFLDNQANIAEFERGKILGEPAGTLKVDCTYGEPSAEGIKKLREALLAGGDGYPVDLLTKACTPGAYPPAPTPKRAPLDLIGKYRDWQASRATPGK